MSLKRRFINWIALRAASVDEFAESLCYCGHTYKCSCSHPDEKTFEESVERGVITENDTENGCREIPKGCSPNED